VDNYVKELYVLGQIKKERNAGSRKISPKITERPARTST
jgi:hypothetical protein